MTPPLSAAEDLQEQRQKKETQASSNIVAKISQIADNHLTIIRNISTGLALAGVVLLARSIKLTSKFGSALEIPAEFIEKNVRLRGRVHHVTEKGLEVEHVPISVPVISSLLRQRRSDALLLVRLAGVEVTEDGRAWLKQQIKPTQIVWFKLLSREESSLDCLVMANMGGVFRTCLNEELLGQGFGKTVPVSGLHYQSRLYWKVHKRLLKAELKAQKKGRGLWKERDIWKQMIDNFNSYRIVKHLKKLFKRV
ncbi:protein C3orf33-like [Acipenser oxyrinchus oxyrinchus]|uniref:Protein C3orf33-like n=1 Tax=Acipenser oxyrinchus oxyrinchus TaxID=40147 RepID=A0AAD8D2R1_ACIOX|nr:protein C3orf33-like [Acipenser oxyrinchus oxyrinchus]